jgi:hypothetical protein
MRVPPTAGASPRSSAPPPSTTTRVPDGAPGSLVTSVKRDTDAMAGRASPRKPLVRMWKSPSLSTSLLVACRSRLVAASSRDMPHPSSTTVMSAQPPRDSRTVTLVAPASMAFSASSFTTEAGRSTTSPAAIWFTRSAGSRRILPMGRFPSACREAFATVCPRLFGQTARERH